MKVGVAELLSRKRRFCWLMPSFLAHWGSP
jgi:hypothetical protein